MSKGTKFFLIILFVFVVAGGLLIYFADKSKSRQQNLSAGTDLINEEGIVAGASTEANQDQKYIEELAKYLTDQGMVMYGAYWCPHCQDQKKLFGDAVKFIDYVECDSQGPDANTDECTAQGIKSYPTWIYQGNKYTGYKSLSELAQIVGFSK